VILSNSAVLPRKRFAIIYYRNDPLRTFFKEIHGRFAGYGGMIFNLKPLLGNFHKKYPRMIGGKLRSTFL